MTTPQTRAEQRAALIKAGAIADDQSTVTEESFAFAAATPNRLVPSPAVRTWIYSIIAAAVPLLVLLGVFTVDVGTHVLNIAAALLAVGGLALAGANTPKG